MGSVGPTNLIALLLAVAIISATCGFVASAVARRNRRRARGFFLLGFLCGFIANPILRRDDIAASTCSQPSPGSLTCGRPVC